MGVAAQAMQSRLVEASDVGGAGAAAKAARRRQRGSNSSSVAATNSRIEQHLRHATDARAPGAGAVPARPARAGDAQQTGTSTPQQHEQHMRCTRDQAPPQVQFHEQQSPRQGFRETGDGRRPLARGGHGRRGTDATKPSLQSLSVQGSWESACPPSPQTTSPIQGVAASAGGMEERTQERASASTSLTALCPSRGLGMGSRADRNETAGRRRRLAASCSHRASLGSHPSLASPYYHLLALYSPGAQVCHAIHIVEGVLSRAPKTSRIPYCPCTPDPSICENPHWHGTAEGGAGIEA